MNEPAIVR